MTESETGLRRGDRAYTRASAALFLAGFSTFSLLYCVQPLLPVFADQFGAGAAQSSLALSLATGPLAVSILLGAMLAERFGRRRLMVASLLAAGALTLAAAAAPGWVGLLGLRVLTGIALGGVPAVAMAYLAEEFEPAGLGRAMGLYVAGTAFGGMAGRVMTGVLTDLAGWRIAIAMVGVTGLAAAVAFFILLPASRNFTTRHSVRLSEHLADWTRHLTNPALAGLFAVAFLAMGAFVSVYNYAGFRLSGPPYDLAQSALGLVFTLYLLGMIASAQAGGLADRLGRAPVLIAGLGVAALGVMVTLAAPLWTVITGIGLVTAGFFAAHSVASGWVGRASDGAKGHAASLYLLAYYLGSSLAGSAGGLAWDGGGWTAVSGFVLALLALAGGAAAIARQFTRPHPESDIR